MKNRRLHTLQSPAKVEPREVAVPAQPIQEQPIPLAVPAPDAGENEVPEVPEVLTLLQKAYEELSTRKQTIQSELARIEGLRGEHEVLTAQVAALDQALKAFQHQPRRETKTA